MYLRLPDELSAIVGLLRFLVQLKKFRSLVCFADGHLQAKCELCSGCCLHALASTSLITHSQKLSYKNTLKIYIYMNVLRTIFLCLNPETHEITDFCSFYIPSSIFGSQNYSTSKAASLYDNVVTQTPLLQLMNDAPIVAKQKDYDVFNALDVMHNESFLKELKFGPGDGQLHYYLYNYWIRQALRPSELGLVLL
ncbi:hypothetical protein AMTRI_Chr05g59780 [Amborella trichopoda]